jgi:RNA polymerase sigma-70 factor (ECF subfamily)
VKRELVDRLYRTESPRLLARLTRVFGPARLELCEAALQEAFVSALAVWPERGMPESPAAWLWTAALNRARDELRKRGTAAGKQDDVKMWLDAEETEPSEAAFDGELPDDQLAMMFVACHPSLSSASRVALTLRTLCGFEVAHVARALLSDEAAVEKRLVRARQKLRDEGVRFEVPAQEDLAERREAVLTVLYLLFNEGYGASEGERHVREELCAEAIRLTRMVAEHPVVAAAEVHALLALMLLQASRLGARADASGRLLTLAEQDRSRWDRAAIAAGLEALARSAGGPRATPYHLEAGIAACHAMAASFQVTDWARIVSYYGELLTLKPSPVVRVNRAIAVRWLEGPERGLEELERCADDPTLQRYVPLHAARAEACEALGRGDDAARAWRLALSCAGTEPERRWISSRLASDSGSR